MIISASRRTDIPAFYSPWFMNRIREGFCLVPNPFHHSQVSRVSLETDQVDAIVFWTRNPRPLLPYLDELDGMGYRYVFLYTVLNYPHALDPGSPPLEATIETFRELSSRIGSQRMTWRYDPIVFSSVTDRGFHKESFGRIAEALKGAAERAVISTVKLYRKARKRIRDLAGIQLTDPAEGGREALADLMRTISILAKENGMTLMSCADEIDLASLGVPPGRCIDGALLGDLFGFDPPSVKDPSQRGKCGCSVSKDIGMYDSCLHGCAYCYANTCFERSRANYAAHDPLSPSLIVPRDSGPKPGPERTGK